MVVISIMVSDSSSKIVNDCQLLELASCIFNVIFVNRNNDIKLYSIISIISLIITHNIASSKPRNFNDFLCVNVLS